MAIALTGDPSAFSYFIVIILIVKMVISLIQYRNGEDEKPKADDLLVFTYTTYGHVVIITEVGENYIEVVQQNMGATSRDKFDLEYKDGKYFIFGKRVPAGWLRVKS